MTVNAAIITDAHQDVLTVPSSAVKTQGGSSYVMVFNPEVPNTGGTQGVTSLTPPQQVPVEVGISDDKNIEILSGLSEGQQIVTRTITASAAAAANTTGAARTGAASAGARGNAGFGTAPVFIGR